MGEKVDFRASGSATLPEGEYGNIHVSASFRGAGSITCDSFHCSGAAKIQGNLNCKGKLHCSGSVKIQGDLDCQGEVHCSGATSVEGSARIAQGGFSGSIGVERDLTCLTELSASGSVKVGGKLTTEEGRFSGACEASGGISGKSLSCSGVLRACQGVEAELFKSTGKLQIQGLLNAEQMEIAVNTVNEVEDIGGTTIRVYRDWKCFSFGKGKPALRARAIEGDRIDLESTCAQVVRGKTVCIGRDCEIDRVEYTDQLSVEDGAVVRESVKL